MTMTVWQSCNYSVVSKSLIVWAFVWRDSGMANVLMVSARNNAVEAHCYIG